MPESTIYIDKEPIQNVLLKVMLWGTIIILFIILIMHNTEYVVITLDEKQCGVA